VDLLVGDVRGAHPDRFPDALHCDETDAGPACRDPVRQGAHRVHAIAEHHVDLRCPIYSGQGPPSRIGDDLNGELVSSKRGSYSPEFKEAAVREVIDQSRPIADVARRLGLVEQTLGTWVKAFRAEHVGEAESELPVSVRARVKELEREVRELRMENEFLGKSVAFFAKKFR